MAFSADKLIFRDVAGVMACIVPFAAMFSVTNQALQNPESVVSKAISGAAQAGGAPDAAKFLKEALSSALLMGASFSAFNLTYGEYKKWHDKRWPVQDEAKPKAEQLVDAKLERVAEGNGVGKEAPEKPDCECPHQQPSATKKFFTSGIGKLVFRDVGSIMFGALPLGFVSTGLKRVISAADPNDFSDRWLKDYAPAAAGYASYFVGMSKYREMYDRYWDNVDKKQEASAKEEKPLREALPTKGWGKLLFRDVGAVLLGFLPHRGIRMWFCDQLGNDAGYGDDPDAYAALAKRAAALKAEGNTAEANGVDEQLQALRQGPKKFANGGVLQGFGNWVIENSNGAITLEMVRETIATGFGFSLGYVGVGESYRAAYDTLARRVNEQQSAGAAFAR